MAQPSPFGPKCRPRLLLGRFRLARLRPAGRRRERLRDLLDQLGTDVLWKVREVGLQLLGRRVGGQSAAVVEEVKKSVLRWRRLDFATLRASQGMRNNSGESLSEDVTLKARLFAQQSKILRGRQLIWLMTDSCRTNRCLL